MLRKIVFCLAISLFILTACFLSSGCGETFHQKEARLDSLQQLISAGKLVDPTTVKPCTVEVKVKEHYAQVEEVVIDQVNNVRMVARSGILGITDYDSNLVIGANILGKITAKSKVLIPHSTLKGSPYELAKSKEGYSVTVVATYNVTGRGEGTEYWLQEATIYPCNVVSW
jgi:hypothetical protein